MGFYHQLMSAKPTEVSTVLQEIDLKKLCSTINNLPELHFEYMTALIVEYHQTNGGGTIGVKMPYDAKIFDPINKRGLQFNFSTLPQDLQYLIIKYVETMKA